MCQVQTKPYYVYTLAYSDGTVFYVGKGTGDRIHQHEYEAARTDADVHHYYNNPRKCAVIREIWARGEQVKKSILFETDVELNAYIYEWALINMLYQGKDLTNMNNSGRSRMVEHPPKPAPVAKSERQPMEIHPEVKSPRIDGDIALTVAETCAQLRINRQTLDKYVERGQLVKYRRSLARRVFYKREEVNRLLQIRPEDDNA